MQKKLSQFSVLVSFVIIFLFFFLPPKDTDLGWQLRYGEYFFQTGNFLKKNILTYFIPDYFWPNSYTLYQVLIYSVYKLGAFSGLSILNSILFTLAYFFFQKDSVRQPFLNMLFFFLISFFSWHVFFLGIRSQLFSFFFFLLFWYLLKKKDQKYNFFFLPLTICLWANFHGGYILGFLLLFAYLIKSFLAKQYEEFKTLIIFTFLSFITTLVNPYNFLIYKETFHHLSYPLHLYIAEWLRPNNLQVVFLFLFFLFSIYISIQKRFKNWLFYFCLLTPFFILSLHAKRNIPFFYLIFFLYIKEVLFIKLHYIEKKYFSSFSVFYLLCFTAAVILLSRFPNTNSFNTKWSTFCNKGVLPYPCQAIEYIKKNRIIGKNVFSSYEWGGFLSWQLPNYYFFVDGRTPTWLTTEGKSPYTVYLEIIQAQPGYLERLDKYQTSWLLIGNETFLDIELKNEKTEWKESYRDNIAVIYEKE